MYGTTKNKLGKVEKNTKVKEGDCIFPFKYKWKTHNECVPTDKGVICATSVTERGTLKTYGYCVKKGTEKKEPKKGHHATLKKLKGRKLKLVEKFTLGKKRRSLKKPRKLKIVEEINRDLERKLKELTMARRSPRLKAKTAAKSVTGPAPPSMKKARTAPGKIAQPPPKAKTPSPPPPKAKTPSPPPPKAKTPSPPKAKRYNEEFVAVLGELKDIMLKQGEPFRARAYNNAQETIMTIPVDITNVSQLKGKKGIGETILRKLEEYVKTGTLRALERERKNPVNVLTDVYGIGPKKAKELVKLGITSIEELEKRKDEVLNDIQKIGLKYYYDILQRIPRKEIEEFHKTLVKEFAKVKNPGSTFEIVGSYRRGKQNSGDIDMIITDNQNDKKVFDNFLDQLISAGIVTEILTRGKTKSLTIGKLPGKTPRRLDFLYSSPTDYPFAILYFTGSKFFNTVMRQRALDLGYSLNEHGLYLMQHGKKGAKVDIQFPTEQSIFDFLNLEYKTPVERIDGRAIIVKDEDIAAQEPPKVAKVKSLSSQKAKTLKKRSPVPSTAKENIIKFQKQGIDVLKTLTEKQLDDVILAANEAYHNKKSVMTDNEYDIVKEYVERKYPKNVVVREVGAPVEKNKVQLPYYMASMDKIKPDTKALTEWMRKYKGPYVLSGKLDGISGLYSTEGTGPKLFTRGNGRVGQDISYMIPYLRLPKEANITIRGELIIPKELFEKKYKDFAANPRNLVAGIVNAKSVDKQKYRDIDFVAYEVIVPSLKPSDQMRFLEAHNVDVVINDERKDISNEILSELLIAWRDSYVYEIDGVIVENDKVYPRSDKNPKHAFAFKMVLSDQVAEAKVVDVIWTPSKDGYLKPRIRIEPIWIGGAKIEYATAFNGAFVEQNKLGIGAVIQLVRSGDVIPHILAVITPATHAKMPHVPYKWNDTHVDVLLVDKTGDEVVKEKVITGFFRGLDVEGLSSGNVRRIIQAGYDTVPKILKMEKNDFLKVEGFKDKLATKVFTSIHNKIRDVSLAKLMTVTNIFGRGMGEKRIEAALEEYPNILTEEFPGIEPTPQIIDEKVQRLEKVNGFAKKNRRKFRNPYSRISKIHGKYRSRIQIASKIRTI